MSHINNTKYKASPANSKQSKVDKLKKQIEDAKQERMK